MKMQKLISGIFVIIITAAFYSASAQCEGYGFKQCVKYLQKEYKSNGQSNSASIAPGETARVNMVFYKGYDYRVVFCGEEHLGQLGIKAYKAKGKDIGELIFDNSQRENAFNWDFSMTATHRVIIEVTAPGIEGEEAAEGCVTIVLGLRNSTQKGFK